ncbi:hypothetical protein Aph02nite_04250 [Actinoplanes philippinensis]|uniref:HicB family protein n=1 Tax=Actinoplanes philippinensis TaxID=35752 RepID=A0A1I2D4V0_9ACTN|nr:hypothetical protein [Actinoplanes philippinensis]GIE74475.1 hypothetical protein Aph02nite_04250 [Actinoplanes philippinensis]SFE75522.1 hypothetical protein SAMN05421541_103408 [Actinoplanes philippinensis]
MDLTPYLEGLRADLAAVAAPAGPDTVRAADLLGGALESSARLALLEALSDAAAEITTRLSGPVVEVRLRGREADLVVTGAEPETPPSPPAFTDTGGDLARLTLRMPESLKTHVEQTAAAEGISVNAWLVRAVTSAIDPGRSKGPGSRRVTGFFQA